MARTKRKINPLVSETPAAVVKEEKRWRTAGYARLSVEDSGKPGSETLDNQKSLIQDFIVNAPDLELTQLFFDNGQSGTDFQRPGFERLMDAIRKGEANCIVVKDLSRFGRNYKETGNFLERIFPFLGVRFIAITDNFDTLTAERGANGYIIPLKNLINETYSRDISKKIAASVQTRQQHGDFIGAWAPYGYSKDPENHHHLIPNPETAPVVQRIFQMRVQGMSYQKIMRTLTEEEISCPSRYLVESGVCKNAVYANAQWNVFTIKNILNRQVYIGHMVQGRKFQSFYDGQKQRKQAKEDWVIVENTHQPIIDPAIFEKVQCMEQAAHDAYYEKLGRFDALGKTENLLRGLIYCADCGRPLVRYKTVSHGKKIWYNYICPTHSEAPSACPLKSIREDELMDVIQESIAKQIALAVDMRELTDSVNSSSAKRMKDATLQGQLEQEQKALRRAETLRDSLYQNYVEKLMSEQEYMVMKARYTSEAENHKAKIEELKRLMESAKAYTGENRYLASFSTFQGNETLTRELLTALIDRIEIMENNRVNIVFRYQDEYRLIDSYLRKEASADEYRCKVSSHFA